MKSQFRSMNFYKFNQHIIFISDIIAIQCTSVLLYATGVIQLNTSKESLAFLFLTNFLWIVLALLSRSYQVKSAESLSAHLSRISMILVYYLSVLGLFHFIGVFETDVKTLIALPSTAAAFILIQHVIFYNLLRNVNAKGAEPIYVIGATYQACEQILNFYQKRGKMVKQYAVLDEAEPRKTFRILELLRTNYIEEIVICNELSNHPCLSTLLRYCKFYGIKIKWHQPQTKWSQQSFFNTHFPQRWKIQMQNHN